jgi:hypothetical protein
MRLPELLSASPDDTGRSIRGQKLDSSRERAAPASSEHRLERVGGTNYADALGQLRALLGHGLARIFRRSSYDNHHRTDEAKERPRRDDRPEDPSVTSSGDVEVPVGHS